MKSTPSASRICASTKWPIRALAITGMLTACWISRILPTAAMRATPPSRRMSDGHALERHHRRRAGLLGDLRLLGVGHVHDHAALEHLGEADVLPVGDPESVRLAHRCRSFRSSGLDGRVGHTTSASTPARAPAGRSGSAASPRSPRPAAGRPRRSAARAPTRTTGAPCARRRRRGRTRAPGVKATPRRSARGRSAAASQPAGSVSSSEKPPWGSVQLTPSGMCRPSASSSAVAAAVVLAARSARRGGRAGAARRSGGRPPG